MSYPRSFHRILSLLGLMLLLFLAPHCSTSDVPQDTDGNTTGQEHSSHDGSTADTTGQPPEHRQEHQTTPEQTQEAAQEAAQEKPPAGPDPLSMAELQRTIEKLASDDFDGRNEGTSGGQKAQTWLIGELQRCKIPPAKLPSYVQKITTGKGANILGWIEGTDPQRKDRTIILSAHYDHLGHCNGNICNGADDNAAGVAIVLGIACKLIKEPLPRSVLIALWDAEEPPTFLTQAMGSMFYVNNPVKPLQQTDVAIVLDLVGSDLWRGFAGHFLLGAELSPQVTTAVSNAQLPQGLMALPGGLHLVEQTPLGLQPWSDYHGFRQKSVPVLFLSNGQNKRYHTPADEMASINMPKVTLEAQYLYAIVKQLGNAAQNPMFASTGNNYKQDAATLITVVKAALAPGGLVESLSLSATSRSKLKADLERLQDIQTLLNQGGTLSQRDLYSLRSAAQRIMCLAGPSYPEATCQQL